MTVAGVVVRVTITGAVETIRALERIPRDAKAELHKANRELSRLLAGKVKTAAEGAPAPQAALMVPTVRVIGGDLPGVLAGGSQAVGRYGVPAYELLIASEFGAVFKYGWYARPRYRDNTTRQYPPRSRSYWFFRTADEMTPTIVERWGQAADEVVRKFGQGG